ncbi:hypothetical protein FOA43_002073 [Brettanomyces nanus]|uniref:Magnesium transporter n=1 Tax=Eeniella nana TaxID=13502 RepID=A0A875RP91_EENNA|nr:uncharacterized protein FOA43_002073 [Brettanomyces nanus]QPG74740.1 hypothetical protein FOA43_002073 [Brettanomyces nanus]
MFGCSLRSCALGLARALRPALGSSLRLAPALRPTHSLSDADIDSFILEKNLLPRITAASQGGNIAKSGLRCIVFDHQGHFQKIPSVEERVQLMNSRDLLPRDLRKIDKGYDDIVPSILIRENSILLSILHIRALIKADSVVLFNYDGSYSNKEFIKSLSEKLRNDSHDKLHYEVRALEAIFIDALDNLNSEMRVHVSIVNGILKELEDEVDLAKLKYLLMVSKRLQQFQQKATLIRDLIDELLDQDDELAELYLTEKMEGLPRSTHDHQEVELLLESYSLHCDAIVQTVENSISDVKTTEEIINIILDSNRNDLMLLGLRFSAGLMSFGSILFPAAVYGMNLQNFFEQNSLLFSLVIASSCLGAFLLFRGAIKKLTRLKKIQIMKP